MRQLALLAAAALAATAVAAVPAAAQDQPAAPDTRLQFEEIPLDGVDRELLPALADPQRTVSVMVQLAGDPVAVEQGEALEAGAGLSAGREAQVQRDIEAAQDAVIPEIERRGGRVQSQVQHAYNGIRVRVPAGQVPELADLPGVVAVHASKVATPDNISAAQLLQVPGVWEDLGFTGKDVKVGIIDSGIDYYHANFGGSGDVTDHADDDPTVIEPGTFPSVRVAGGIDLVGDAYDPQSDDPARNTPRPDTDPLDCSGHGSHVAGTVAGNGVRIDRTAYTGPYDSTTHSNGFLIGPGFAPEATLYAVKIFGCTGGTASDLTVEAIDWAVANDLDVVNMSFGASFGRVDDAESVAATNAALAGVVVVAGAGNDGAGPYITKTPAAGAGALAVAAVDTALGTPLVSFTTATDRLRMTNVNGSTAVPLDAAVRLLTDEPSTPADESRGCDAGDYATVQPGEIVVTRRGQCADTERVTLASLANAGAAVMINTLPGQLPGFAGSQGGAIPLLGADRADEAAIVAAAGGTALVEDDGSVFNPAFGTLDFTSSGPRNGDSGLKPDVTAPGVDIVSTAAGTGYGALRMSGTSMATAFVSGVAALVREAHPTWRATQVKAAIINTALPLGDPAPLDERRQRSHHPAGRGDHRGGRDGRADAEAASRSGWPSPRSPRVDTRTVTVTNRSNRSATYTLSPELLSEAGRPALTFSQDTVTVPPRAGPRWTSRSGWTPRSCPGARSPAASSPGCRRWPRATWCSPRHGRAIRRCGCRSPRWCAAPPPSRPRRGRRGSPTRSPSRAPTPAACWGRWTSSPGGCPTHAATRSAPTCATSASRRCPTWGSASSPSTPPTPSPTRR